MRRRLADLGEVRAARALAALDPVAGDADVVGRGRPRQVDPASGPAAVAVSPVGVVGRVVSVGGVWPIAIAEYGLEVARGVGGPDPEAVGRVRRRPGADENVVVVRGADLGEVGAAGALSSARCGTRVTPTLSVDAVQARLICVVPAAVAVRPVGAVGGVVSPAAGVVAVAVVE